MYSAAVGVFEHEPWDVCVDLIVTSLTTENEDDPSHKKENIAWKWQSGSNLLALSDLVIEFYTLYSMLFQVNMKWDIPYLASQASSGWFPTSIDLYPILFWMCVTTGLAYPFLAVPGMRLAQKNQLGLDANGQPATFPAPQFFYSLSLTLLGSSLYFPVLLNLVQIFVCDYDYALGTNYAYVVKMPSVECWSLSHLPYVLAAAVAIIAYYPMASFMFPNLQFIDRSLDIKYDTTFLIIVAQGKLFLAGVASVFPTDRILVLSLILVVDACFVVLNVVLAPCLITSINPVHTGSFVAALWGTACTMLMAQGTVSSNLALIGIGAGDLIILALVLIANREHLASLQSVNRCCRKNRCCGLPVPKRVRTCCIRHCCGCCGCCGRRSEEDEDETEDGEKRRRAAALRDPYDTRGSACAGADIASDDPALAASGTAAGTGLGAAAVLVGGLPSGLDPKTGLLTSLTAVATSTTVTADELLAPASSAAAAAAAALNLSSNKRADKMLRPTVHQKREAKSTLRSVRAMNQPLANSVVHGLATRIQIVKPKHTFQPHLIWASSGGPTATATAIRPTAPAAPAAPAHTTETAMDHLIGSDPLKSHAAGGGAVTMELPTIQLRGLQPPKPGITPDSHSHH